VPLYACADCRSSPIWGKLQDTAHRVAKSYNLDYQNLLLLCYMIRQSIEIWRNLYQRDALRHEN